MTYQAGSDVISNGWKAAGITEALSKGLNDLESLNPFKSIDPLVELNVTVDQSDRETNANQQMYFVTTKDDDRDETDEDWVLEEKGEEVRNDWLYYDKIDCIII